MDAVISLHGFCRKTGYCNPEDDAWTKLERVHIVIGERVLADRVYGLQLFLLDSDKETLIPVTQDNDDLLKKLETVGI